MRYDTWRREAYRTLLARYSELARCNETKKATRQT